MTSVSDRASVVIVGGGIVGVSTAFHLAEAGVRDVLLVEKDSLGAGSTSKAAGGVRASFSNPTNIALGARSLETWRSFDARPGGQIDLEQVGYLFLLSTKDDLAGFSRAVALQAGFGLDSRIVDVEEVARLNPLVSTDGLLGAAFSPGDGYCTPEGAVAGYASAARRLGARLVTGVSVSSVETSGGEIVGVRTSAGFVRTPAVICCAGAWSRSVGEMAGVPLPVTPVRRQIAVTGPVSGLPERFPMTLDYSSTFYFHREGHGLLFGMSPDEEPGFRLGTDDRWLAGLADAVGFRAPALADVGIAHTWAGLYEITPDHDGLVGESGEVSRFLYACGFSGHGFLMGPAVGEAVRDLFLGRTPVIDVSSLSADRFAAGATRVESHII
ncbi:NAD(P)/FAD-dependent oxidoreductase [Fodinicola acaciae]|uniref:NAD(P)/FAD-dependent oxidoreductase n=1 Tax=Fodinicola acaciae TaxID=2681555 RepID=UPI0013D28C3C|nr:FAD-binding oxidoreductase [Fodinicola acaciae]